MYYNRSVYQVLLLPVIIGAVLSTAKRPGKYLILDILITVTSLLAIWHLKLPASRLFTQPFIQAQIKESTKSPRHWLLCGEFTADR